MRLKFNNSTFRTLSNICLDIAQIFFGAFWGALVLLQLDPYKVEVLVLELALALSFWYLSIKFGERGKI